MLSWPWWPLAAKPPHFLLSTLWKLVAPPEPDTERRSASQTGKRTVASHDDQSEDDPET